MIGTLKARLFSRVTLPRSADDCWLWQGARGGVQKHAQLWHNGKVRYAHRLTYEMYVGPIPDGMVLDHVCGVSDCVNPEHLRPITQKQNGEHRTKPNKNSTTGYRGVTFQKASGLFVVQVKHNRQHHYGGYYKTAEAAGQAAEKLRAELFTHDDWSVR